ncbi:MAG: pilin [Patescibacteria group bacterium]
MPKKSILYIFFLSIFTLIFPNVSQAAGILDGLPCIACGSCGFADIAKFFYDFIVLLLGAMGAVALVYFVWGGIQWLTSGGSAERVNRGKQIMINTVFAIILAFGSNLLVKFFIDDVLGVDRTQISADVGAAGVCNLPASPNIAIQGLPAGTPGAYGCTSSWEGGTSCGGNCAGFTTSGIKPEQCSDASPSLVALLACLKTGVDVSPVLNPSDIIITSISQDVGLATCRDNWLASVCVHARRSCHYGGPSVHLDGSYAADLRSTSFGQGQRDTIRDIIEDCGGNYYYHPPSDPPTHIHISAGSCGAT